MKEISVPNEVTDPALGFPNPASQCHTCGAKDYRTCEGMKRLMVFIFHAFFVFHKKKLIQSMIISQVT